MMVRDHRYLFAATSVVTCFLGVGALFYFSLVGGNPYKAEVPHVFNIENYETTHFHSGDWVIVRRPVCLERDILAVHSPALYDLQRNALIPLPSTTVIATKGCAVRSSMFRIPPNLPSGVYEYRNVSRYQNNLVGRDEASAYPPKMIEVNQ